MEFCCFLRSANLLCDFSVDFLGAVFACGYSGVRVAASFEKLAHFLAFVAKVGVVTAEAPQFKKLREEGPLYLF